MINLAGRRLLSGVARQARRADLIALPLLGLAACASWTNAPQISAIPDQTTLEGETLQVNFTVTYQDLASLVIGGAGSDLALSATSSNQALVPNTNLQLSGDGDTRTLTTTPATSGAGTTIITITAVGRNGQQASHSFNLTVNPTDAPPEISAITDQQTVLGDTAAGAGSAYLFRHCWPLA